MAAVTRTRNLPKPGSRAGPKARPKRRTDASGAFSDLEGFVLGLVWQHGPVSVYDIRQVMLDSPSTQWSASTGAIYPLARNLERAGLIAGRSERTSKRRRRTYQVTPAGLRALRAWVGPPLSGDAVSVVYDPLRTRARFVEALPPERRLAWVAAALSTLDEVERRVARWDEKYVSRDDADGSAAPAALRTLTRHSQLDLQGRRAWLADLERALTTTPTPAPRRTRKPRP